MAEEIKISTPNPDGTTTVNTYVLKSEKVNTPFYSRQVSEAELAPHTVLSPSRIPATLSPTSSRTLYAPNISSPARPSYLSNLSSPSSLKSSVQSPIRTPSRDLSSPRPSIGLSPRRENVETFETRLKEEEINIINGETIATLHPELLEFEFNSEIVFNPNLPDANKVVFYSELLNANVIGILCIDIEMADTFATEKGFTVIQPSVPAMLGHYLQLMAQPDKKYWSNNLNIREFSFDKPFESRITYMTAKKDNQFLTLVIC